MDYTFATVIIPAEVQQEAQADLGAGFFEVPLSVNGSLPATNFMSSGPFNNEEIQAIVNDAAWPNKVYFGQDWQAAVASEGLQTIQPEVPEEPVTPDE